MQIVLNIIPVQPNKPVDVVYLSTLSKGNILKVVSEHLIYPDRYVLTFAENLKKMSGDTEAKDLITLAEYIESKGIEIEKGEYHKLANHIAKVYLDHYRAKPRIVARPDDRGKFMKKSYGFDMDELWVIQKGLEKVSYIIRFSGTS